MLSLLRNAQHWRERATQARELADQEKDPQTRERLLRLAEAYEGIADRANIRAN